jgi:hypothetical protein
MKLSRSLTTLTAALILPFALAACGPSDDLDTTDELGDPAATPAPETPPAPTGMDEIQIAFTPIGASTLTGEVRINDEMDGQASSVTVRLTGGTAGSVHQGHIHTGTCDAPGGVVAPLEPVTIGEDGTGEVTVSANTPTMTLANGSHIVLYHAAGGTPGEPIACAAIPAHTM